MDNKVGDGGFKVAKLSGDAIVIDEKGNARDLKVGDVVTNKDTVIVVNGAEVELKSGNEVAVITQNCVACFDHNTVPQQTIADAPIGGEINVDLSNIEDTTFAIDEIEALQAAILAGEDPTAILEAAAAGGVLGSANAGFVTIDYTNAQTLAQTFFETSAPRRDIFDDPEEDGRSTVFAAGGETISETVIEGDLELGSGRAQSTASIIIEAGDLPLDPLSFVPEPAFLAVLLVELNSDIKSSGQDVLFTYDAVENAIIGVSGNEEVLRIDIDTVNIGKNLTLTLTTTLSEPIDHFPVVDGGNVALVNDQILITIAITGTDSGGNSIRTPISATVTIVDDVPVLIGFTGESSVDEDNIPAIGSDPDGKNEIRGNVDIAEGADGVKSYQVTNIATLLDGLTSGDESLEWKTGSPEQTGTQFTYTAQTTSGDTVFSLVFDTSNNTYSFTLVKPFDHADAQGENTLDLTFQVTATDFDNDTTTEQPLVITVVDDIPVINNITPLRVDEDDIPTIGSALDGSNKISGNFDIEEGADGIKSYQITNVDTLLFGLTSGELALEWKSGSPEQSGTEFTYTAQTTAGDTVFTLVFDTSDNSYRFTLDKPLDHPDVQGENTITLNVMISATDFDNDTTAAKSLDIVVVDDIPLINEISPLSIDEDDLPGGIDAGNDPLIDSGVFDTTQGADRVVTYSLESLTVPVAGLESQGKAITIAESYDPNTQTYTYTGSTDDGEVFVLTLSGNGAYQFELKAPIDHAVSEDDKDLTFAIVATDQDGDTSTKPLVVKLVDDAPILNGFSGTTTVDEDDIPAIGSALDGSNVIGGTIDVEEGADGVKSYQVTNTATLLNGLTSGDEALEWKAGSPEQDSGKFTYTAQTTSGATVFTLVFDTSNNSYQFTLFKPLDHADAQGENNLELAFQVSATDFDNDTTGERPLTITVVDDIPLINTIAPLSVDEDDLVGGTDEGNDSLTASGVFDTTQGADGVVTYQLESLTSPVSGLLSQGKPVTISESFDTATKTHTYTGETADGPVFVLTLSGNGNYQFELKAPIDHPDSESNQDLTFSIVATDQDGDTSTKPLVVTLEDDAPILNGFSGQTSVDEDDIPTIGSDIGPGQVGSNIIGGTVDISEGADGVRSYQVTNIGTLLNGLSSGDDTLEWKAGSPEQVGTQFTYTAQTTSGETVFSLVFDTSDNSYSFTLDKPLNHVDAQGQNTLDLTFEVTATDFDNDITATKPLIITVVDDIPLIKAITPLTVDEDDLANGTDTGRDSLVDAGVFDTTQGADRVITYHLESLTVPVSGLMSQGKEVSISESFDSLSKTYTYTGSSDNGDVFVLTLNGDGNYQFELKAPIDHATNEDDKDLTFSIVATDRDGDTSTQPLVIKLVDDAPVLNGFTGETSVDEDDIPTIGSALDGSNQISGNFDIEEGADGIKSYQITNVDTLLFGLTSGELALEWKLGSPEQSGTEFTYTAQTTAGDTVFTLVFDTSDNSYRFTLDKPLDHPDVQGENTITLNVMISATDFDNDTTAAKSLDIVVVDDIPLINEISPLSIDEDDLPGGIDAGNDPLIDSGVFDTTQGADRVVTYSLESLTAPVAGLESQGKAITIAESYDPNTQTYTYTGSTDDGEVFVLTLSGNGAYQFELKAPIDHAVSEDDKDLTFAIVATDQDSDTSTKPLVVKLVDDAPILNGFTGTTTVDEDDIPAIGSALDGSNVIGGTIDVEEGADGVKSYQVTNTATLLNGLTSGDEALEWKAGSPEQDGGKFTYTAQTTSGSAVFSLVFDTSNNSYQFTLFKPLDHADAQGENNLELAFQVSATDFDNDTTGEQPLTITVVDDIPLINTIAPLSVDEDDLVGGTDEGNDSLTASGVFDTTQGADGVVTYQLESLTSPVSGLLSQGKPVTISESFDTATKTHTYTGETADGPVFVLILSGNGNYQFELKAPIDHPDSETNQDLTFSIVATDQDGDTSTKPLVVTLEDDAPILNGFSGQTSVDEDDIPTIGSDIGPGQVGSNIIGGTVDISEGADGVKSYQVTNIGTLLNGLSSGDDSLEWKAGSPEQVGTQFTYTAQTTSGETVFSLVFDTSDNSYSFTLDKPLNHVDAQGQNTLDLTFEVTATDFDNDTTAAKPLVITVVDDVPQIDTIAPLSVDEDDLANGTDAGSDSLIDTGVFDTTQGADQVITYHLESLTVPVSGLMSQGKEVSINESFDSATKTYTYTGSSADGDVFVLTLKGDGNYQFELKAPIDHAANEDDKDITFSIVATDRDGDTSIKPLVVKLVDDAPVLNGFTGETSVDEDDIPTIGSAQDGSNEISGNFDIDAGADGLKSFQVTNVDSVLTGLKSGTEAVEWQAGSPVQNGTQFTYTAQTTSGAIVFTFVLDTSDNSYRFTLSEPLDHPTAQGENSLALDFMLSATDFDGDTTAAKPLTITLVDDIPLINTILPLSVDEDDLVGGSDQGNDSLKDSGVFDVTQGADQVITYHLASLTDPVAGLQSQGKAITISEVFDQATQTYTYTGSTADGEVFILTLNGSAGSYEFELKAPIDHSDTEDDKDITFSVVATDQDGDTSTKPLIVNLVDDAPEINSFTGDQIVNEDDIAIVGSDPDKEPITIGGTFDITEGADALKAITIANEASVLNGLKSGGENLEWATTTTVGDVITYTAQTETGNEAVFTMVFNTQTQRYDFTLLKALDHPTGQGENQLDINFQISVIDFDNDESSAIALPITVIDDVPTVDDVERLAVNENDLSDGSSPSATELTVDGSFTTVQGADSVVKYSLESTTSPVTGLQSGGIDVAMSGPVIDPATNQHTYTGSAGGVEVFVLTLKANGDYSFELKAPIDHAQGSDLTTLTFPVIATDFDGDTSAKSILVDISDDLPTMTEISGNKLVDEDDLARIGSDGNKESTTAAGNFIVEEGADGIREYEIVNLDSALDGLKSDEQDLVWAAVQTDGTKVTHTAQTATDGDTVFTLIFDTADNSYAFTIEQPFDHPAGQGQNDITIGFDIRGLDFDKDPTATLPLDIVVRDDVPNIIDRTITVIEGETNSTRANLFGKPGADGAEITLVEGNDTPNGEIRFLLADGTYVDALDPAGARTTVTVVETIRDSGGTITDNIVQGTLQVRPTSGDRGQFRFTPVDNLEHESGQFTFSMTVTATDGDQDTSVKTYTVNILDRDAIIESSSVVSFEDLGRDSSLTFNPPITNSNVEDNQGSLAITPSKVDLTVKLFDLDNGEKVGTIIIEAGMHNGKFYFLDGTTYTELTTQPDGRVVLNADDVQQTIDPTTTIASIDNLYFVPDRNYSSGDGGFSVPITVEILNGVTPDHAIGGNLNIEVEAVADIAEWNDANSLYTYSLFEDGENANLALQAVTQDGSNPETITYRLEVTAGEGKFELLDGNDQVINEVSPGVYEITSGDINSVQVNPIDHFSGFIKFNATALTEETDNALAGKEQAESVVQELVINVNPIADQGSFSVSRITIFEDNAKTQDTIDPETDHEAFTLNKVISLGSTDDIDTPNDDSEAQFVHLDNFKSGDGSVLVGYEVRWIGTGDSPIVELSPGVFEIPEAALPFVEIQPPLHSNVDFSFDVVGIVKDTATLADGSQVVDTKPMGAAKTVNVTVKGVADIPFLPDVPEEPATGGVLGTWYEYDPPSGLVGAQVSINESTEADISFAVLSGEEDDSVFDGSESLSVLLSNIPDGVELFDANGGAIDLVYVGQEGGKPIYQANITQENYQSGITIRPPKYSTDDITIDAKVVVTENDGHVREVNGVLKVNIEPVIEMGGATNSYSNTSAGNEDTFIRVPWTIETNGASPDSTATTNGRDYEFVTEITISGFPTIAGEEVDIRVDGNDVVIDGVLQPGFTNISYTNGVLNITGLDQSSTPPKIFVRPGEDSSKDFTLTSVLKVKEIDEDDPSLTVEADVTGQLSIVVRPVVEPDGTLSIEDSNGNVVTSINDADDGNSDGRIDFTINDQNGDANIVKFQDLDPSSTEDVDQVVVRFAGFTGGIPDADLEAVMDQLIVFGAVNNGDGSWTILDEENFTISAPKGLTYPNAGAAENSIKVEFVAEVRDAGDEGEGSAPREVKTIVDLVFPSDVSTLTSEAAEVEEITAPTAIILGQEDNQFDVSSQLSNVIKLKAGTADGIADQVTIVIAQSDIPAEVSGLVISGGTYDFANEMYIFEAQVTAGGDLIIPAGWEFITPEDYAGDFIIPMSVVTTDTISGDEKVLPVDVKFAVTPLVDVPVSSGGSPQPEDTDVTPSFTIDASSVEAGTGAELSADALEDNLIKLELDIALADERDAPTQGRETLSKVEIELVDSDLGFFADINGDPITTTTPGVLVIESSDPAVIEAALQAIYFVPKHNYPTGNNNNTVEVRVTGTVSDKTIFDQTGTTQTPDEQADKTFSAEMSFDITPVVDPVTMPEASDNIVVVGDEDTDIHLESNGSGLQISLTDTDGSEQFLSAKLTGVPDDFIVDSTSSDFVVKNNGGGEWTIQLTNPSVTSIDLSQVTITPAKNFSGKADINIVVFTQEQLLGVPVEHTGQFTIDVTPVGDPVDTDPVDSVTGDEGQNIDITINASVIDKIDLLPSDSAQDQPETLLITVENVPAGGQIFFDDGITLATDLGGGVWQLEVNAQSIDKVVFNSGDQNQGTWDPDQLTIKVQSVDTGYDGVKHLGPISQFEVGVVVEAVNDRPYFENIDNLQTAEDTSVFVKGFTINDIDATLDDPNASYTLTLNVDSGTLVQDATVASNNNLTVNITGGNTITISGTVSEINQALTQNLVSFTPAPDSNDLVDPDGVKVTATVDDNGNLGLVESGNDNTLNQNSTEFVINVSEVNDKPIAADVDLGSINEDTSLQINVSQLIGPGLSTDPEGHNLIVKSISVPAEQGEITANPDGVSWTFTPKLDFSGDVTISYVIEDDGTTDGNPDFLTDQGTISVTVVGVNDAPEVDVTSATSTIDESAGQQISGITIADVDYVDTFANDPMSVELSVSYGALSVNLPAGSSVTVTPASGSSITLEGTLAELNTLLNSPATGEGVMLDASFATAAEIALTVSATDSGNPSGMSITTSETHDITVNPVADAPTLSIQPGFDYIRNVSANLSVSNNGIAIVGLMAALTDVNEVLSVELSDLPAGASVETASGPITADGGIYSVPAADIDSIEIVGAGVGSHTVKVTAVSTDDGQSAQSAPIDIVLNISPDGTDIDQSAQTQDVELLGDDTGVNLTAGAGDDRIVGGDGGDILTGGAGNDEIIGGAGADTIDGGLGSDILTGGTGNDIFVWHEISDGATDTITDFTVSEDKIDLRDVLPELKSATVGVDDLLDHIQVIVQNEDLAMTIHPDGVGSGEEQTILVENLAQDLTLGGLDQGQILNTLIDQNIFLHDS